MLAVSLEVWKPANCQASHRLLPVLLLVLVSKLLHEAGKSLHALKGHGVVDGRPHATDRAVALQLGLQQQAQQAYLQYPAHQQRFGTSLWCQQRPPYMLLSQCAQQTHGLPSMTSTLPAPVQLTAQQLLGSRRHSNLCVATARSSLWAAARSTVCDMPHPSGLPTLPCQTHATSPARV